MSDTARPASLPAFAALLGREFRVELRTKSLITSMGLFAALCVVIFGLGVKGLMLDDTFRRFVLAALWVCSWFAAVVGLNRAASADRNKGFFSALMLIPHDPALVYAVRLVAAMLWLVLTQALMIVLAVPMLRFDFFDQPLMLGVLVMSDLGVLAPGVLLASATGRARGGEALLTIALLPVTVPVFLGATGATEAMHTGTGSAEAMPFVLLLAVCDAMFLAIGLLLFGKLNEG
ncbi:MAG: heme exporter protein CcmB [Planctomycetes bacterium]|nr:heme exporter protein CcmB [Planctomycetota bacterium]MCW8135138.1 heme exporter protein CcmB [Planctomycetota bacterium]